MRRGKWLQFMLAMLLVIMTGCGAGGSGGGVAEDRAMSGGSTGAAAPSGNVAAPIQDQAGEVPATTDNPSLANRKIIYHAETDLQVKDADEALGKITAAVQSAGGFIESSNVRGQRPDARTVTMKLRVPASQYNAVLTALGELGEQANLNQWTQDVTAEYVDVNIRIETREAHLARLKELAARAGSISELLELEQEIARVTADLESLKGRLRVLSDQIDLSTITVRLYEPAAPRPVQEPKNIWERARNGFIDSWNGTINFIGDLFVFGISAIPRLVFLAIVAVVIYAGIRLIERKRRPPSPPAQPPQG